MRSVGEGGGGGGVVSLEPQLNLLLWWQGRGGGSCIYKWVLETVLLLAMQKRGYDSGGGRMLGRRIRCWEIK